MDVTKILRLPVTGKLGVVSPDGSCWRQTSQSVNVHFHHLRRGL